MATTTTSSTIGERIRSARKQAGITRAQLASAVGASVQAIGFWETGVNEPRNHHLQGLCKALGIALIDRISIVAASAPIGDQIRAARNLTGLSLAAVGERIGVSAQAIHKWEKGDSVPSYHHLQAITTLLGMDAPAAAPAAPAALHELLLAELIINTLQNILTDEQRLLVAAQLAAAGLQGSTPTRSAERRAAITAAGAA